MSDAKLKTKIKGLFKAHLESQGFVLAKKRCPERMLQGLRQGIEFQPGSGFLDQKYTLNIYWSFPHLLDFGCTMDAKKRIAQLVEGIGNGWFSRADADIDTDFQGVERLVVDVVLPYLAKYDTIEKIVHGYESGALSLGDAFGDGWGPFNIGYCYAYLGNKPEAIKHYQEIVSKYSTEPYDWVQERKRVASEEIARLSA
jgi:hypothetical protein